MPHKSYFLLSLLCLLLCCQSKPTLLNFAESFVQQYPSYFPDLEPYQMPAVAIFNQHPLDSIEHFLQSQQLDLEHFTQAGITTEERYISTNIEQQIARGLNVVQQFKSNPDLYDPRPYLADFAGQSDSLLLVLSAIPKNWQYARQHLVLQSKEMIESTLSIGESTWLTMQEFPSNAETAAAQLATKEFLGWCKSQRHEYLQSIDE